MVHVQAHALAEENVQPDEAGLKAQAKTSSRHGRTPPAAQVLKGAEEAQGSPAQGTGEPPRVKTPEHQWKEEQGDDSEDAESSEQSLLLAKLLFQFPESSRRPQESQDDKNPKCQNVQKTICDRSENDSFLCRAMLHQDRSSNQVSPYQGGQAQVGKKRQAIGAQNKAKGQRFAAHGKNQSPLEGADQMKSEKTGQGCEPGNCVDLTQCRAEVFRFDKDDDRSKGGNAEEKTQESSAPAWALTCYSRHA